MGRPAASKGKIDRPLGRHPRHRLKRAVTADGKKAVTHWRVVERAPPFALMRLRLETGRTHQIRVHLASEGWPILGDPLYGGNRHRGLKLEEHLPAKLGQFTRQALHACVLGFTHPETGEKMRFDIPPPSDMRELVNELFGNS